MDGFATIKINKIKTDNYIAIYRAISDLRLSISSMYVRNVQNIVHEIYSRRKIKAAIIEDINSLKNQYKILDIDTLEIISIKYLTVSKLMMSYFKIIDESNDQALNLINVYNISSFGLNLISNKIKYIGLLKEQQKIILLTLKQI
ncbi:hypothetical protein [Romboutsia timonensis]|uniref:hypothetical protein n=1 Tax=Romboutsia timonensis TaxID=1776391 RepID=UPI002A831CCD|nr:hypothetical protein [Romboutsia timonensis]